MATTLTINGETKSFDAPPEMPPSAFKPAVATGITVMHLEKVANFWIYIVGNFAGGTLAAVVFKLVNPEDK